MYIGNVLCRQYCLVHRSRQEARVWGGGGHCHLPDFDTTRPCRECPRRLMEICREGYGERWEVVEGPISRQPGYPPPLSPSGQRNSSLRSWRPPPPPPPWPPYLTDGCGSELGVGGGRGASRGIYALLAKRYELHTIQHRNSAKRDAKNLVRVRRFLSRLRN
jgi:hypothetical protein